MTNFKYNDIVTVVDPKSKKYRKMFVVNREQLVSGTVVYYVTDCFPRKKSPIVYVFDETQLERIGHIQND